MFEQMITSSTGKFCSHFLVPDSLLCIGEFSTQIAAKVLLAVRGQPLLLAADHWGWEVHLGATLRRRKYSGCCTTSPFQLLATLHDSQLDFDARKGLMNQQHQAVCSLGRVFM
jgi:hypothetical protein